MAVDIGAAGPAAYITTALDERLRNAGVSLAWEQDRYGRKSARIRRIAIGRFGVDEPMSRLLPGQGFGGAADAPDGLLGTGFLRRFRFFVDYSRRELILEDQKENWHGI